MDYWGLQWSRMRVEQQPNPDSTNSMLKSTTGTTTRFWKHMPKSYVWDMVMVKVTNYVNPRSSTWSKKACWKSWSQDPIFFWDLGKDIAVTMSEWPNNIPGHIKPPPPPVDTTDHVCEIEAVRKSKRLAEKYTIWFQQWKSYTLDTITGGLRE